MSDPLFEKLCIIGIGLIGSSIARAVRKHQLVKSIAIADASAETLKEAETLKLGDAYHADAGVAARDADLIIICVPIGAYVEIGQAIAPNLKSGAILSDVGSVKQAVVRDLGPLVPDHVHFIPGHPVAGTEHSGPKAGFAELFEGRWCILTPPEGTDPIAVEKMLAFWRLLGANVETMTPDHHDLVLAITSHLPHLIAYTIVGTAEEFSTVSRSEVLKFSAGGFRDFTRIAASDPTMWRDVFLHNKDAVLEMLAQFSEDLAKLTRAMRRGDGDTLFDHFTRTRAIRRGIVQIGQDSPAPDFGRAHPAKDASPLPRPYAADSE
jgi:cyclohexadieny/prephenate dehydrogenase